MAFRGWWKLRIRVEPKRKVDIYVYLGGARIREYHNVVSVESFGYLYSDQVKTFYIYAYERGRKVAEATVTIDGSELRYDGDAVVREVVLYLPEEQPPEHPTPPEKPPTQPPQKKYKLYGFVKDNLGYAVEGAFVKLDGKVTTTDNRGYYEFEMDKSGFFTLTVEKTGYEPASIPITFLGISDLRQDVTLVRKEEPKPPEPERGEVYELVFVYKKLWYAPASAVQQAADILARATTKVLEKIGGWKYVSKRIDESNNQIIIELEKVSSPAIPIVLIVASVLGTLIGIGIIVYFAYLKKKEERKIVEATTIDDLNNAAYELWKNGKISDEQYYKILDALTNKITQEDIKKAEENAGLTDYLKQTWDMLKYALPIILIVSIIKAVKD